MAETTIYDVAKRAGVAISTVSKVLSGRHPVSAKTRQRVLQAVEELGYVPYLGARSLAGERTHLVGVVLTPDLPEAIALLEDIEAALSARGFVVLLVIPRSEDERVTAFQRLVRGYRVDGVLLVGSGDGAALLDSAGCPYRIVLPGADGAQAARELVARL